MILGPFYNEHPRHAVSVDLFTSMLQSYGWSYCSCKYQEEVPYAEIHGANVIASNAAYFLRWFMVRKVFSSGADKKRAATAMSVLLRHCKEKGYVSEEETLTAARCVQEIGAFDADGLGNAIQTLYDTGFWDLLRSQASHPEEENDNDDEDEEAHIDDEGGMTITEVRSNAWNMKGEFGRFGGCWAGESGEDEPADVFLQLPPGVAAKGKTGTRFSCMGLTLRRGVWSPVGMYGEKDMVYAKCLPSSVRPIFERASMAESLAKRPSNS